MNSIAIIGVHLDVGHGGPRVGVQQPALGPLPLSLLAHHAGPEHRSSELGEASYSPQSHMGIHLTLSHIPICTVCGSSELYFTQLKVVMEPGRWWGLCGCVLFSVTLKLNPTQFYDFESLKLNPPPVFKKFISIKILYFISAIFWAIGLFKFCRRLVPPRPSCRPLLFMSLCLHYDYYNGLAFKIKEKERKRFYPFKIDFTVEISAYCTCQKMHYVKRSK